MMFLGKAGHCDAQTGPKVYEFGTGRSLALTSVPSAMAVDPAADRLWVALSEGKVEVIDTVSLASLGKRVVGAHPYAIALAPLTLTPPSITVQPQPQTVTQGANALFSVGAAGTPPLSYQWLLNGTLIGGATNSFLSVSNAQSTNVGYYSVMVNNAMGRVK